MPIVVILAIAIAIVSAGIIFLSWKMKGRRKVVKVVVAFFVGVWSFALMMFVGEAVQSWFPKYGAETFIDEFIIFIVWGGYFLVSQYLLSRGNLQAIRKDWPIIIAMNFTPLSIVIVNLSGGHMRSALETLWVAIVAMACSYAGAALATRAARH